MNPSDFDKQGNPTDVHGKARTMLKDYNGNFIQQYGTRTILGKGNSQYWRFVFHVVEAQGPILIGLNTMTLQKAAKSLNRGNWHPPRSTKPNQARYYSMEVESINRQGAAGPAEKTQCSRPADDIQTSTRHGYVNPTNIDNDISVSFSERLSTALSLKNRLLRTTVPAIKLPAYSESVKISPQTSK